MEARAALLAANELLRYRPVDDLYEEWLDRVAELVRAAGGSPAPSHSLPPPQPAAGDGLMACPHRLDPKTVPWRQGACPRDAIRRARRTRVKKRAAKKSHDREKLHQCSPCHLGKTACCL